MDRKIKSVSIELTNRCNLICKHCSTKANPDANTFLDLASIKKVLYSAKEFLAEQLSLSGGEPLLHPDIEEILLIAKKLKYKTYIYSSGIINKKKSLDDKKIKLIKEYADRIIFSLFSDTAKIHNQITNVNASFELTLQSIKKAVSAGLKTEVHTVPMSVNYRRIPKIINLLKNIGINNISLLRLVPQGRCIENRKLIMNKKQLLELKKIVKKVEKENNKLKIRKGAPYKCLFIEEASNCSAGEDKILVSPNGDIHPCEAFKSDKNVSNIKEKTFYEIWQNDKRLNQIRNLALKDISGCDSCSKLNICMGGCPGQRWLKHDDITIGPDPDCLISI